MSERGYPIAWAAEMERSLGSPWSAVAAVRQGRGVEARRGMIPHAVRTVLKKVRLPSMRAELERWVLDQVDKAAEARGLMTETFELEDGTVIREMKGTAQRRLMAELAVPEFLRELRAEVASRLMMAHRLGACVPSAERVRLDATPPTSGAWVCPARLGLGTGRLPDEVPDGAYVGIATMLVEAGRHRVLSWGAGVGALATALRAVEDAAGGWGRYAREVAAATAVLDAVGIDSDSDAGAEAEATLTRLSTYAYRTAVVEVDTIGEPSGAGNVVGRYETIPAGETYDVAVVALPPPVIEKGVQRRNMYKDMTLIGCAKSDPADRLRGHRLTARDIVRAEQRETFDLGRLGPARWKKYVRRVLVEIVDATTHQMVVMCPKYVREGWDGRIDAPELTSRVASVISSIDGVRVTGSGDVVSGTGAPDWSYIVTERVV